MQKLPARLWYVSGHSQEICNCIELYNGTANLEQDELYTDNYLLLLNIYVSICNSAGLRVQDHPRFICALPKCTLLEQSLVFYQYSMATYNANVLIISRLILYHLLKIP